MLALVAIGLTVHPLRRGRLTRIVAFGCYLAAIELLGLLVSGLSVGARVAVGVGLTIAFLVWEWRSHRELIPTAVLMEQLGLDAADRETGPAAYTARDKAKITHKGGSLKGYPRPADASDESSVTMRDVDVER